MKAKAKIENPFLDKGYEGPEYFCDREKETEEIISAMINGRNLVLISPRRMGKTGLIHHVFHNIRKQNPDAITLYFDIFPTKNMAEFVALFASTVLGQLDSVPKKMLSLFKKFVQRFRPVLTMDELTGLPQMTVDVTPANEKSSLKDIFDYLESSDYPIYIAIDEFQQITEYPEKGLEAALRSRIQNMHHVHFIFSGSRAHLLAEMFFSPKRPFFQSTQTCAIHEIDKDKYYEFAAKHFAERGLPKDVFSHIYDSFEGHTWFIQAILNRIYKYGEPPKMESVQRAIEDLVSHDEYNYQNILNNIPSGCVDLLKAVAREGKVSQINSSEFIAKHHLKGASSVNASLRKLIDMELIYKTIDRAKAAEGKFNFNIYSVYDRFLAIWLRSLPY
jgi:AAA+ ATPase superfamily predicted ATPase